ncbi:cupin domain-containing protein [Deinococcus irradiatisoli]|uniref:cupin domain-containing protein n=1 Tax=Deinococcus irradiatisoli TaxID=2202254 RepID=UPI0015E85ACC|nr:hypothetical protein [Deinococcus irradiatisoli]
MDDGSALIGASPALARVTHAGERRVLTLGPLRLAYLESEVAGSEGPVLELLLPPGVRDWPKVAFERTQLTYFVVSGEVVFSSGARTVLAGAETSISVPPGLRHALGNEAASEAHVLLLARPGGLHRYFEALAGLRARSRGWPPDPPDPLEAIERAFGVLREQG